MLNAQDYRAKSAEFARRARDSTSLKDMKEFRQRAQAFTNLAENEEWVVANPDKIISNRAPADGGIGHVSAEPAAPGPAEPSKPPVEEPQPYRDPVQPPPADPQEDRPMRDPLPPDGDKPRL